MGCGEGHDWWFMLKDRICKKLLAKHTIWMFWHVNWNVSIQCTYQGLITYQTTWQSTYQCIIQEMITFQATFQNTYQGIVQDMITFQATFQITYQCWNQEIIFVSYISKHRSNSMSGDMARLAWYVIWQAICSVIWYAVQFDMILEQSFGIKTEI